MPRLFVGNFEFEHRLADARRVLPRRIDRLTAELAAAWLAIAEDGDWIWTPATWPESFTQTLCEAVNRRVRLMAGDWRSCPRSVEVMPWGWTTALAEGARAQGSLQPIADIDAVRWANARRTSAGWEQEWNCGLPGSAAVGTLVELEDWFRWQGLVPSDRSAESGHGADLHSRWVLKAEFGMSGRERCVGTGWPAESAWRWAAQQLRTSGFLACEPWVEAVDEVGVLWDVLPSGAAQLVGVCQMQTAQGQYRGSAIDSRDPGDGWWTSAVAVTERAVHELQQRGYFGPVGIDVMQYRLPTGEVGVRPLQDINARWTMGRLALGWSRTEWGPGPIVWWHGPARDCPNDVLLRTSPEMLDGLPVEHQTALVLRADRGTA